MKYLVDVTEIVAFLSEITAMPDYNLTLANGVVVGCVCSFFLAATGSLKKDRSRVTAVLVTLNVVVALAACGLAYFELALHGDTFTNFIEPIIYGLVMGLPPIITYALSTKCFDAADNEIDEIVIPERKPAAIGQRVRLVEMTNKGNCVKEPAVNYQGVYEFIDGVTCEKNAERAAIVKKKIGFYDGLTPDRSNLAELNALFDEALRLTRKTE